MNMKLLIQIKKLTNNVHSRCLAYPPIKTFPPKGSASTIPNQYRSLLIYYEITRKHHHCLWLSPSWWHKEKGQADTDTSAKKENCDLILSEEKNLHKGGQILKKMP